MSPYAGSKNALKLNTRIRNFEIVKSPTCMKKNVRFPDIQDFKNCLDFKVRVSKKAKATKIDEILKPTK